MLPLALRKCDYELSPVLHRHHGRIGINDQNKSITGLLRKTDGTIGEEHPVDNGCSGISSPGAGTLLGVMDSSSSGLFRDFYLRENSTINKTNHQTETVFFLFSYSWVHMTYHHILQHVTITAQSYISWM